MTKITATFDVKTPFDYDKTVDLFMEAIALGEKVALDEESGDGIAIESFEVAEQTIEALIEQGLNLIRSTEYCDEAKFSLAIDELSVVEAGFYWHQSKQSLERLHSQVVFKSAVGTSQDGIRDALIIAIEELNRTLDNQCHTPS